MGVFCIFKCVFSQNNFHHELLPHKRFQLSKFCIYGHEISQGYSIMTDNLKRAGIFRKTVFCFLWCPFLTFTFFSKITSGGGNWILPDLGPPEAKAFEQKYSSYIRL